MTPRTEPQPTDDVMQRIVDAAFPTGGTDGPNAWTEERIRVRTRFAEELERILTPPQPTPSKGRVGSEPRIDILRWLQMALDWEVFRQVPGLYSSGEMRDIRARLDAAIEQEAAALLPEPLRPDFCVSCEGQHDEGKHERYPVGSELWRHAQRCEAERSGQEWVCNCGLYQYRREQES